MGAADTWLMACGKAVVVPPPKPLAVNPWMQVWSWKRLRSGHTHGRTIADSHADEQTDFEQQLRRVRRGRGAVFGHS